VTRRRFGKLTVLSRATGMVANHRSWLCVCDCGETVTHRANRLLSGHVKSCGCFKGTSEAVPHTHGMSKSAEYRTWRHMINRCYREKDREYPQYGGRGIKVCDQWRQSFEAFFADMGHRPSAGHSIDRIDNNGNYEPGNCRWATRAEQCRNRRSNVLIEHDGQRKTVIEWSESTGLSYMTIYKRHKRGITPEMGLFANG
jgi:hypothetical protein